MKDAFFARRSPLNDRLQNHPPTLGAPLLSGISPSNKPALSRQRDHSACRRPETPLKVRKTRENLKQCSIYAEIPPPCIHGIHHADLSTSDEAVVPLAGLRAPDIQANVRDAASTVRQSRFEEDTAITESASVEMPLSAPRMQRQKSASRRMLTRMKQGIAGRPKIMPSVRPAESETNLVRRISGRRKQSREVHQRSQSFEVVRRSIEADAECMPDLSLESASVQRSFTSSTVSTAEILSGSPELAVLKDGLGASSYASIPGIAALSSPTPRASPYASPQLTPRPPPKKEPSPLLATTGQELSLAIPCIDLYVAMDASSVDVHSKRDVWIAIEATVRSMSSTTQVDGAHNSATDAADPYITHHNSSREYLAEEPDPQKHNHTSTTFGTITSLRLCFKPVQGCQLREVIGQKSLKNLAIGQQCSLFIKIRVPRVRMQDRTCNPDQESLFAELESIVGTLKMEILHVEARYRHSLLPMDNVVAVKHVCKIKRPKTDSRWSVANLHEELGKPVEVHAMLARYLAAQYEAKEALELLEQYLTPAATAQSGVREIHETLQGLVQAHCADSLSDTKPSVVITDIDINISDSLTPGSEHFSTAPNTPSSTNNSGTQPRSSISMPYLSQAKAVTQLAGLQLATPLLTVSKTTTALSRDTSTSTTTSSISEPANAQEMLESEDSARKLWHHIRRTSLSAKQLAEIVSQPVADTEGDSAHLQELRRRALANKRSIGAETLRAWKWEERVQQRDKQSEAPWM